MHASISWCLWLQAAQSNLMQVLHRTTFVTAKILQSSADFLDTFANSYAFASPSSQRIGMFEISHAESTQRLIFQTLS